MKRNKNLPNFLQSALWSYDLKKLNKEKDKNLIITHILNYGNWEQVCWLFENYSKKEIINVIKNPLKGRGFKEILDYWSFIFDFKILKNKYQKAIFDINPKF